MKDPILLNKLWNEVEAGRVTVMQSGDLSIFKYSQDTHIKGLWNEVNRQARGIIFRADGTVIARPFRKFFNIGELSESEPKNLPWKEGVEVFEKMDGSCGIGYRKDGFWKLATPGSLESDQAIEGTKILYSEFPTGPKDVVTGWGMVTGLELHYKLGHLPKDCTPVFEIIYPDNRIVVDYQGKTMLSLLAIFEHNGVEWHPRRVDQIAELCGFHRPRRYDIDLRGEIPFDDNMEGYVARFGNGLRVKVKSPTYLRIHRILNYMSPKGVIELMRGREYGVTLKQLPDAIQRDFDDIRAGVQQMYDDIFTYVCERLRTMSEALPLDASRKDCALWIMANVRNDSTGLVFGLLDGKTIEDNVWRLVLEKVKNSQPKVALSNE